MDKKKEEVVTVKAMLSRMAELNRENNFNKTGKSYAVSLFKNAKEVDNYVFLTIPLDLLRVDRDTYQRPLQPHVKEIARKWNDEKCDPLLVNYRNDGYFYIINGQHRFEAAKIRDLESLVCRCFVGLSLIEEVELFTEQNEGTRGLNPYDTYKANLIRGEAIDTIIHEVCKKYGVRVEKSNGYKVLKSVTNARKIVKQYGYDGLEWILEIIKESGWEVFKDCYKSDIFVGLNSLRTLTDEDLDVARGKIIEFFQESKPEEISALANAKYPQHTRTVSMNMLLADISKAKPEENFSDFKRKIKRIA